MSPTRLIHPHPTPSVKNLGKPFLYMTKLQINNLKIVTKINLNKYRQRILTWRHLGQIKNENCRHVTVLPVTQPLLALTIICPSYLSQDCLKTTRHGSGECGGCCLYGGGCTPLFNFTVTKLYTTGQGCMWQVTSVSGRNSLNACNKTSETM